VIYTVAKRRDLAAIARLSAEVFAERLGQAATRPPEPMLIEQSLRLFYDADPRSFLVAQQGVDIAGYAFAPHPRSALWRAAVMRGHALRWLWHWPGGWRKSGLSPLRLMLLVQGHGQVLPPSLRGGRKDEARVLVVAVRPDARGRGVGTTLVRHALRSWRQRGVGRVRLPIPAGDAVARRLLVKAGFYPADAARAPKDWLVMLCDL